MLFKTRTRRLAWVMVLALAAFNGGAAMAQDFTVGWNPRSGDVWVDTWLGDMNRYGSRYRDPFIDEIVRYHGAPRSLVVDLLDRDWAPGDIYYACAIASVIGRPCRYVVDVYEADRGQGWGVVAKQLGIKPGSPEFHRLKSGFVPTYDRWARPIDLDDELRRTYPDRGNGKRADKPGAGAAKSGKDASSAGHGNNADKGKPAQSSGPSDKGQGKGQGGGKKDSGKGQDKGKDKGNGKGKG